MATYGGWTGKVLRIDLTTRTTSVEDTFPKYEKYWGGPGLAYKVLWDETTKDTKALDPENPLIFGAGPMIGTGCPTAGRWNVTMLSPYHHLSAPQTAHIGGHFGAEMKFAGWDAIIIKGKASSLVYIAIVDGDVKIVDCPELAGAGTYRTTDEIANQMGRGAQVLAIGPAGENLVAQANMMTNYKHSGQGGAVMGSKNLKAVGILGTGSVKIAGDKRAWRAVIDVALSYGGSNNNGVVPQTLQSWAELSPGRAGTRWYAARGRYWGAANPPIELGTCLPHDKNKIGYRSYLAIYGGSGFSDLQNAYVVRNDGCHSCPIRCHNVVKVPMPDPSVSEEQAGACYHLMVGFSFADSAVYNTLPDAEKRAVYMQHCQAGLQHFNDYGITTNYMILNNLYNFVLSRTTPVDDHSPAGNVANPYVIDPDPMKRSFLQLNVDEAEWAALNAKGGLLDLRKKCDPKLVEVVCKLIANRTGKLGKLLADPAWLATDEWVDANGASMRDTCLDDASLTAWQWGFAKHHSFEDSDQVGGLINTGYNRDCMNHTWINIRCNSGLPDTLQQQLIETEFARVGYGSGMGQSMIPGRYPLKPVNVYQARAAWFGNVRKELHEAMGLCHWNWPYLHSPLKERGYRGDLTLEAKIFSIATGKTMTMKELDDEAQRFYVLHRLLTERFFGTKDMRMQHDRAPEWAFVHGDEEPWTVAAGYHITREDWENGLDFLYEEWGFDRETGAPTAATLTKLGMDDIIPKAQSEGLLA